MERELVGEKQWLTKEEMREGIAVCQSLPGPLAIQVGIGISYIRGGFWGAWAGGWAFILPNFVIVAALGALYVRFEGLPAVAAIFYGVSPAVIALILHSCYRLTKLGMKDWLEWALAAAAFVITVAVQAEVADDAVPYQPVSYVLKDTNGRFEPASRGMVLRGAIVRVLLREVIDSRSG